MKKIDEMTHDEAKAALHRMVKVAKEAKEEQDWCDSGFNEAMKKIGVSDAEEKTTFVTVRLGIKTFGEPDLGEIKDIIRQLMDDDDDQVIEEMDTPFKLLSDLQNDVVVTLDSNQEPVRPRPTMRRARLDEARGGAFDDYENGF